MLRLPPRAGTSVGRDSVGRDSVGRDSVGTSGQAGPLWHSSLNASAQSHASLLDSRFASAGFASALSCVAAWLLHATLLPPLLLARAPSIHPHAPSSSDSVLTRRLRSLP